MLNSTPPLSRTTADIPTGRNASPQSSAQDHDIRREIKRALEGSLEYQVLRKTLISDQAAKSSEASPDADKPERANSRTADQPNAAMASSSDEEVAAGLRVASERMRQQTEVEVRELRIEAGDEPVQKSDPLLLDLDGDGVETSGVDQGLRFDIDADGDLDQTSFAANGDAFLALDRNGNGRIDDGSELFGDQRGHANGFAALADYDDNGDGIIDAKDTIFERLELVSAAQGRLQTQALSDYGIAAINLDYASVNRAINPWDSVLQSGSFRYENGQLGQAVDVMLGYREN